MPAKKTVTRDQILYAMKVTKSGHAAARYLALDWHTLRNYAKMYKTDDGSMTLYESMINPSGKGIPKFKKDGQKIPPLIDILEGRIGVESYDPQKIKYRLIQEGYIKEECAKCGFNERRVIDYKIPLLLHHKDGNKNNFKLDNIEMLCYNHFFLYVNDIFNKKDELQIETPMQIFKTTEAINWELDDYHLKRLRELGLADPEPPDDNDPYSLVSRK